MTSKAGEVVWAGGLAPEAEEAAEEGLTFRFFGVEGEEGEVEDMLHGAGTEARHRAAQRCATRDQRQRGPVFGLARVRVLVKHVSV